MLPAFNMLAASVLALAWLAIALLFPILAVWFCVHVARDLRRIATALEAQTSLLCDDTCEDARRAEMFAAPEHQRVRMSMFGR